MNPHTALFSIFALCTSFAMAVQINEPTDKDGSRWFEEMHKLPDGTALYTYGSAPAQASSARSS